MNTRFVLVLGAGPRAQGSRPSSRRIASSGLRVVGFLDDEPGLASGATLAGPRPARRTSSTSSTRGSSTRSRSACRSRMWSHIDDDRAGCARRRARSSGSRWTSSTARSPPAGSRSWTARPVFSLVSGPDRAPALAAKRTLDFLGAALGLVLLSPILAGIAVAIVLDDRPPGAVPPAADRPPWPPVRGGQVPVDGASTPRTARAELADRNEMQRPRVQGRRRPARDARRALPAADLASTSCRSSGTCCGAR